MMRNKKEWIALLLAALVLITTACSSAGHSSSQSLSAAEPSYAEWEAEESSAALSEGDFAVTGAVAQNRKLIRSSEIRLETKAFDEAVNQINDLVVQLGGYMESAQVDGTRLGTARSERTAEFVARVPADRYRQADEALSGVGNVVSRSESADDITDQYYDVQAELESLRVQQERLLAMMEQAADMEDLITLESELTDVRTRINERTSAIKRYDGLVEYATIRIALEEVVEYQPEEPETFGDRVYETFVGSLEFVKQFGQGVVLLFVAVAPFVVIYGGGLALIVGVILFIMRSVKRRRQKKEKKPQA